MGWFDQPGSLQAALAGACAALGLGAGLMQMVQQGASVRLRRVLAGVSACAVLGLVVLLFMARSQEAQAPLPGEAGQAAVPQPPASPPALQAEVAGESTLKQPDFMRLSSPQAFVCKARSEGFRQAELAEAAAYVAEYRRYVGQLRLAPLPEGVAPDAARLARLSLLRALDDALLRAQMPPGTAEAGAPQTQMLSEQALARSSAELKRALATLQGLLRSYREFGEPKKVAALERCAHDFALKGLAETEALMHASRLYLPALAISREQMFVLGSEPVLKDFLARQRARAQVLLAYAEPFLSLLSATPAGVKDAPGQSFWQNSTLELQRAVKSRESAGQVAALEAYFIRMLDKLDYRQCSRQLAAYTSPEPGNDLFSQHRLSLERMVELRCNDYRVAQAREMYGWLEQRFNRELAGRYPFAGADAPDASPATVRAFLLDYAAQRATLEEYLDVLSSERKYQARDFVRQLDAVAAFFRNNLSAGEAAQPFRLQLAFNLQRRDSRGTDQVLAWTLRNDSLMAGWPNRAMMLDWHVGEHLTLNLDWAVHSRWMPVTDPQQAGMWVEGPRATFAFESPWALLRMIERHGVSDARSAASGQILLGFSVPVQGEADAGLPGRSQARLYLGVTLLERDAKTQTEALLRLPARFPHSAPSF